MNAPRNANPPALAGQPGPARVPSHTPQVVVLGSLNRDLVMRCAQLPLPGQTIHGRGFDAQTGGKGANQAVAAARLGASVSFIGCVGDDDAGRSAAAALAAEGINTRHLRQIPGAHTGVAMILVDDAGQNCIALAAGANAALSLEQVDAAAALIQSAALLICQLESPMAVVQHAMGLARAAGVRVLLNPAPAQALSAELLAWVDILVPNETEAAALAPPAAGAAFSAATAARQLQRQGPRVVMVTLGADGVVLATPDEAACRALPAPRVRAVDTTGAGDTFIGAFAAATCAGAALEAAIDWAQRAAAHGVQRAGTWDAMPRLDDLGGLPAGLA